MEKQDIYEHLAKIYLDASSAKKKKQTAPPHLVRNLFVMSVVMIAGLTGALALNLRKPHGTPQGSELALVLSSDVIKINFNFDPAKKETYTLDLKNLDMSDFRTLTFAAKRRTDHALSLRVEFVNAYKEKSEVYFRDLTANWHEYRADLSEFKNISDWSGMKQIIFSIEEWNTREKSGVVYIEDMRLLKN
jgi:hypothetical protein